MSILPQLIVNGLIAGSIYALMALGVTLQYGATKFFNIAHGAFAVVGAYTAYIFLNSFNASPIVAVIAALIVGGLAGAALDQTLNKALRKRKATNLVMLVASLGIFTAIQSIIAIIFSSRFKRLYSTSEITEIYSIAGATFTQTQLIIFIAAIVTWLMLAVVLKKTLFGKLIKAVSDDVEVSTIIGIRVERVLGGIFFIASAIAGLAGALYGFDIGIEPVMGMSMLLKGIIAAIIGGLGNIHGAIIGAFALGIVENLGIWKVSSEWKDVIAYVIFLIFLLFRPQGIFGKK